MTASVNSNPFLNNMAMTAEDLQLAEVSWFICTQLDEETCIRRMIRPMYQETPYHICDSLEQDN